MLTDYVITRMTPEEMNFAIQWAANEGWNPGVHDAECFYHADPDGFFVGKLNGKIIAIGSAVVYDDDFAFCGLYLVEPGFRGQGYGLELTKHRLDYVGQRNAGIDGVLNMLSKYERLGYRVAHANARYCGSGFSKQSNHHAISPLLPEHFELLLDYDSQHFPAPRPGFLRPWIHQPQSAALGWFHNHQLQGYGVIRPCLQGYKIGPLFADNTAIAFELFTSLASFANGETVYLDIPENNAHAVKLVNHYQMKKVFETARMYLKREPNLPIDNIFGITTFELG